MTIQIINEKRIIPNAIIASLIVFAIETGLYWSDFANHGFWPTIGRRFITALTFFAVLVAVNSYQYSRRQRKNQNSA